MIGPVALVRGLLEGLTPTEQNLVVALAVLFAGLTAGVIAAWLVRKVLLLTGVDAAVEGTVLERSARRLGSSTVRLLAGVCGLFVFLVAATYATQTVGLVADEAVLSVLASFVPRLFVAVIVLLVGLLVGEKVELVANERLRSIKLPELTLVPTLLKFSIYYVAGLIALSQIGVATAALLVLLAAYAFGVFFLGGLAFKDLLASAAAGVYLLLTEPYSIGDEIAIDGNRGIVQEVDVFVTQIENEDEEYIVPNRKVLCDGATRIRR
ncbi:MAG: mechanosensitive ion channel [Natronomonas sp.]